MPVEIDIDFKLLEGLKSGNIDAFNAIYKKFAPQLFRYARRNIDSKEDCQEIVQDIFTGIWANRESWNIANLQAYLFRSVRNSITEYFRRSKVKWKYEEHYKLYNSIYDTLNEGEIVFDPADVLQVVERSLPELSPKCQTVFRLRLFENLTNSEIAERMNVKKATIEHYIVMAVGHLREAHKKSIGAISIVALTISILI